MRHLRILAGVARLVIVALRYRLDDLLGRRAPWPLRWLRPLVGKARPDIDQLPVGSRVRLALEHLGPIFVKCGQILSTRRDLLPPEMIQELAMLQDQATPFDGRQALAAVEQSLGKPVAELFASFDQTALASASIAQVHAARLHTGEDVVVKVLRPQVHEQVARDLTLLHAIAGFVDRHHPRAERIRPREVIMEIEATLANELDLQYEGANASTLARTWNDSGSVAVPQVYGQQSSDRVLTLERMHGIPISEIERMREAGIDPARLARRLIELFYTQVFRDNLFHADLHPGNLLVQPPAPAPDGSRDGDPVIVLLDFGLVGTLSSSDQRYLAENFMAMFTMDYRRVAELHLEAGWMPRHVRIEALEAGVRTVCEPYFTRPLSQINLGEVLFKLFRMAQRYELTLQPQLILLQKTLLNVEGLSRWLDPEIDIWAVAQPVLADIMRLQYGHAGSLLRTAKGRMPDWLAQVTALPRLTRDVLLSSQAADQDRRRWQLRTSQQRQQQHRRLLWALLGTGALVAATVLQATGAVISPWPAWPSPALLALAVSVLAWARAFSRR